MKNLYFIVLIFSSYLGFSQTNYQRIWGTFFGCKGTVLSNSIIDHQWNIYLVGYMVILNNNNDPIYTTFATTGAHLQTPGSN